MFIKRFVDIKAWKEAKGKIEPSLIFLAGFIFFALTAVAGAAVDINNVAVSAIKTDSVVIGWDTTSTAGTSQIEYGTSIFYGNTTAEESLSYFHTTELSGLAEGTLYHYRIRSKEYSGIETVSADYTFTTRTQAELEAVIRAARADKGLPKTYYVSPTGSDSNDGLSTTTPFQHPSYAVNKTDAGDTVYLMDGTWNNEHIVFPKFGIDVAPITLTAYNRTPILDGMDKTGEAIVASAKAYINIANLSIRNYNCGVFLYKVNHISVSNIEVNSSAGDGIAFRTDSSYVTLDKVTVKTAANHGILSFGYPYDSSFVEHVKIVNSVVSDTHHNGIDLHTNNRYVTVDNNELDNITNQAAIFSHNFNNRYIVIKNNNIRESPVGVELVGTDDSIVIKNNIVGSTSSGIDIYRPAGNPADTGTTIRTYWPGSHKIIVKDNKIVDTSFIHDIYIINHAGDTLDTHSDILLENNSVTKPIRFYGEGTDNLILRDISDKLTMLIFTHKLLNSRLEFGNGKVFLEDLPANSIWYPEKSNVSISDITGTYTIVTYPLTACPASGSATVAVNKFDTTLTKGNILVDFTADTANGNNIDFIIADLKADTNYQVTRAGVNYHVVQSNSNKCIAFSNSEWSTKTFTITETAAIADIITPPEVNLGSKLTNLIDINQDGTIDISDLRIVALHFGEITSPPYPRYDVNTDGTIDILDLRQVAGGM